MHVLITPRLALPPWEPRFLDDLVRLSSDERVMRFVGSGPWKAEYAAERHERAIEHWKTHDFGMRAITDAETGAFLGLVALGEADAEGDIARLPEPVLEIGWWIEPDAWGRGIATEAAAAVRDEAFSRVAAASLLAGCDAANAASERIMVKLGMRFAGEITDRYGMTTRLYGLTKPEWETLRG